MISHPTTNVVSMNVAASSSPVASSLATTSTAATLLLDAVKSCDNATIRRLLQLPPIEIEEKKSVSNGATTNTDTTTSKPSPISTLPTPSLILPSILISPSSCS